MTPGETMAVYKKGFTLMEILATIALIALILPVAMKGIALATSVASDSKMKQQAIHLAQNQLAEILIEEEWQDSSQSGEFSDDDSAYRWEMNTSEWSESGLKQIDLTVSWDHRGRENNVTLSTLVYNAE
jgi:prepilin-type N-terminal cleavage/methylation domain-containing protein